MAWKSLLLLSWLCVLLPCVTSSAASSDLVVRNLPGKTSDETVHEVRRRLANRVKRAGTNVLFDNSTSFSLGLDGVTIFKYPFFSDGPASVTIVCTKCYIKGHASAKLTANGSFNISSTIDQAKDSFEDTWHNLTDWAGNFADEIFDNFSIKDIGETLDKVHRIDPPVIDLNLDIKLPEYNVAVNLTDVEVYMEIDTILSAGITYTFNIYQSETIVGVALGDDLLLGAVFSVDLIFSVDSQIDIRSGFHVHFDSVITHIDLFGKEASKLDFDGGKIAFLPVSIQYGQVILKAILRVEARIGVAFETVLDSIHIPGDFLGPLKAGAGVEARIYANVAEFITNITLNEVDFPKRDDDSNDDNCQLIMAQGFTFGIGAAAGASIQLLGNTWGPSPQTEIPIFYTTLAKTCVTSKSSAPKTTVTTTATTASSTSSSAPGKRADSHSVTSTVTTETQVATICVSAGLINCPASLQNVTRNVVTRTLTSTITPGASVAWTTGPVSTFNTVDFQEDAVTMTSSSGKPKSYTPPPPPPPPTSTSLSTTSATDEPSTGEKSGKHRVSNAVIIGVSVGLGVPVLLAVIGAFIYFFRRSRKVPSPLLKAETATVSTKAQPVVATYAPVRPEDD